MDNIKQTPIGRLQRLSRLARVGTRTGVSLLFSRDNGESAAEQAAQLLGSMRGLAAKVGQMASYVDGFIPAAQQPAFEEAMKSLRDAAPQSPPDAIRGVLEEELGKPPAEVFAEFDEAPFASASIGQVHRARLKNGEAVAVKVQHPGVDKAIENDLQSAGIVKQLVLTLAADGFNADALFEEVASRFREELDYRLEARRQQQFAQLLRSEPRIRIPRVFEEYSTRRVLTSTLAFGMNLDQAQKQPEDIRRSYAELLWHYAYKPILVDSIFNADPHPGNYLFQADGSITCLDFGCVQKLRPEVATHARAVHLAALQHDERGFKAAVHELGNLRGGAYEEAYQHYLYSCLAPLFSTPFKVTRDLVSDLVKQIFDLKRHALSRRSRMVAVPESTVLLNRLQFGFMSVVARLDVAADFASIERRFLQAAGYLSADITPC